MKNIIRIYNTLSKRKEAIKPSKGKKIKLFVCGATVYDFSHLGHARTYIIFDAFVKYLNHLGYKVFYLQNVTNVDDKIIARAKEKGVLPKDLANAFEKEHLKDMKALGINSVAKYARATDYVKEIISQVKRLLENGYAYELDDGIYYNIRKFNDYGKLSGRSALQSEDAISRIDYNKNKKNRGDFCLWKFTDIHNENEPSWKSPFGKGRPGWHIEDTAITEKFFGYQYDIHGGGRDLIFPHHEAEIAQMESISGKKPLAKYWMHTGFLTINDQKMSKSLNNFITISGLLKRYPYQYLRFWIIKNLWRMPINYSDSAMIEAKSASEKIEEFLRKIQATKDLPEQAGKRQVSKNKVIKKIILKSKKDFYESLNDDFNTPKAFAVIFDLIKETNKFLDQNLVVKKEANEIFKFFEEINKIFDIIDFKRLKQSGMPKEVKKLLEERENYRKSMDWPKADEMRKEIEKYGYTVEDTKEGSITRKL